MTHSERPVVLVMAGGTGGHIFPALAAAEEFGRRGIAVHWIGTRGSMEAELVPGYGYDISFIPVTGLRGKGIGYLARAPLRLLASLVGVCRLIRRIKPVCVLGMGGYVTGPGGVAAKLCGVPLVIHEQNAVAGFTNRVLSRVANRVLYAFGDAFGNQSSLSEKYVQTGNPVRKELAGSAEWTPMGEGKLNLLVLGGSRGAVAINGVVPQALPSLEGRVSVWHQAGAGKLDETVERYRSLGVDARVEAFISDMAGAYAWADLVVCRAGALTVAELAAAGKPSLLVPYPHAVDDHQSANGQFLVDNGAALMVQQRDFNTAYLKDVLVELAGNPRRLLDMGRAAGAVAMRNSAVRVVDQCREVSSDDRS